MGGSGQLSTGPDRQAGSAEGNEFRMNRPQENRNHINIRLHGSRWETGKNARRSGSWLLEWSRKGSYRSWMCAPSYFNSSVFNKKNIIGCNWRTIKKSLGFKWIHPVWHTPQGNWSYHWWEHLLIDKLTGESTVSFWPFCSQEQHIKTQQACWRETADPVRYFYICIPCSPPNLSTLLNQSGKQEWQGTKEHIHWPRRKGKFGLGSL